MALIFYIQLILFSFADVVLPTPVSNINIAYADTINSAVQYSPNTHQLYERRFRDVANQPDSALVTKEWNKMLGVNKVVAKPDSYWTSLWNSLWGENIDPKDSVGYWGSIWNSLKGDKSDVEFRYNWGNVDFYNDVRDDIHVFGWHPYWAEEAVEMYDYELLTMVSYYGYEFNASDGTVKNAHRWSDTKLHEVSKQVKTPVNIFLTVFSYDSTDYFLKNDEPIIQLVDDVGLLLEEKDARGVTIDFQNISSEHSDQYLKLLKRFSEALKPKNRQIVAVVPAVDPDSVFPINQMAEYFDYLIITGYDFHGRGDKMGPFSVLYETKTWERWSIEKRVADLIADGAIADPKKVLISLGWIGSLFEEIDNEPIHLGYRSVGYMNAKFNDKDEKVLSFGNVEIQEDKASSSNFFRYQREDNQNWRTYYFADTTSFNFNLDWIQKQDLGGVAIWTLADAANIEGYWSALAETYGRPPPTIMTKVFIPFWEGIVDEWLHPYLSLYLSMLIIPFYLIALIYISYKRHVPEWLRKLGVFLPLMIFLIMLFSLLHDLLAHHLVDQWDDPVKTALSLIFGSLLLLVSLWYCVRVYYLDRRRVP